jgi:hypothetical protein
MRDRSNSQKYRQRYAGKARRPRDAANFLLAQTGALGGITPDLFRWWAWTRTRHSCVLRRFLMNGKVWTDGQRAGIER